MLAGTKTPGCLSVPSEGIDGISTQGLFLDDQFRTGHFKDLVGAGQAHLITQTLREPERLGEADLLLGSVVRELGAVDIHVLEIELRETALLGQGDTGFTQGEIEMDAGIIDLVLGLQGPYAVKGSREISGMADSGSSAGCEQGQAGNRNSDGNEQLFHNRDLSRCEDSDISPHLPMDRIHFPGSAKTSRMLHKEIIAIFDCYFQTDAHDDSGI